MNVFFKLPMVVKSITGIIMSLSLIYSFSKQLGFFRYLDGYSYQIYLLSYFPQVLLKVVLFNILRLGFYIPFIPLLLGGLFVPIFLTKFAKKYVPSVNFVIGLSNPKKIVVPQGE